MKTLIKCFSFGNDIFKVNFQHLFDYNTSNIIITTDYDRSFNLKLANFTRSS